MSETLTPAQRKLSIIIFFMLILASCQKDALYAPSLKQQLIKKEAILELFKETPATGLLTPNWEAAIQGKVGNSSMVRIPIKNWDKLKDLMLPSIELELKKTLTNKQMV